MYLKMKALIMLLRNLHLHKKMCNDIRLIITYLH